MKIADVCKIRTVSPFNIPTPLLIPSFSSRGFPELSDMYSDLRDNLSDASLVSAYDIYYEHLSSDDIYATDTLVIDSGGYEAKTVFDLDQPFIDERQPKAWSREQHEAVLAQLSSRSNIVLVSYDHGEPQPIVEQIHQAQLLFSKYPSFASDFLYKPQNPKSEPVEFQSLADYGQPLTKFSILGITEKELGSSLLERCANLVRIRQILANQQVEIPIHVFGCLEPLVIIAYFLCGADVFDGLSWLRFSFLDDVTMYRQNAALLEKKWEISDPELRYDYAVNNVRVLDQLSKRMVSYCKARDLAGLFNSNPRHILIGELIRNAGVEF